MHLSAALFKLFFAMGVLSGGFFFLMFHCSTCEEGKTQLGVALQYPSVYAYVTLYYFFKTGKVNGGDRLGVAGEQNLSGQGLKWLLGVSCPLFHFLMMRILDSYASVMRRWRG